MELRQLGPGMMQQLQSTCDQCNGVGEGFADKDKCSTCSGRGTQSTREVVEVLVPAGTEHGKQFTFYEKGDERADIAPGDLIVVVQQEQHPVFTRRGANLFMKKSLSLLQSLTGFVFTLVHLDGHKLTIKSKKDTVVPPGHVQVIRGQGMPLGFGTEMGDLYFEYDVQFPKTLKLSAADSQSLARALGGQEEKREIVNTKMTASGNEDTRMEDDEVEVEDVDLTEEREKWKEQQEQQKRKHGATEEDEEDSRGGVPCRTQ